jgi:ComF family protein
VKLYVAGLLDAIFPRRCQGCLEIIPGDRPACLCRICEISLHPIDGPACPVCGIGYDGAGPGHPCPSCLKSPPPFERTVSAFEYGGAARGMITAFKYGRRIHAGEELVRMAFENGAVERAAGGCDLAAPVPMHWTRLVRRTFNQAAVIAKAVALGTGLELRQDLLVRTRRTPPQASFDRRDRAQNIKGAFAARSPDLARGRTVLLVDDVMTTGATASECARVLLAAGASAVRVFTLARTDL